MGKNKLFKNENDVVICDEKKKGEVRKELEYCFDKLKGEYEELCDYQFNYFCWFNARKDVIEIMKSQSLSDNRLEEIIEFCDNRNSFLVTKLKTIHSYISYIENIISDFDNINDFDDVHSIETKLRLMLTSLGMNLPVNIFGEPF